MTIKNQDKNISAEQEGVIVNAELNKSTGILNLYRKNQLTDESTNDSPIQIKLHDVSLNIVKKNQSYLDNLKISQNPNDIVERESTLFLVPLNGYDDDDADAYQEMVWSKEKEDFEKIGTTQLDLDPIQLDLNNLKNLLDFSTTNGVVSLDRINDIEDDISTLQSTKVTVEQGKGLSEANFTTAEKTKLANIQIVDTVANGNSNAVTSNAVYDTINGLNYIDGTDYEEVEVTVTYANNGGTDSLLILAKRSS